MMVSFEKGIEDKILKTQEASFYNTRKVDMCMQHVKQLEKNEKTKANQIDFDKFIKKVKDEYCLLTDFDKMKFTISQI